MLWFLFLQNQKYLTVRNISHSSINDTIIKNSLYQNIIFPESIYTSNYCGLFIEYEYNADDYDRFYKKIKEKSLFESKIVDSCNVFIPLQKPNPPVPNINDDFNGLKSKIKGDGKSVAFSESDLHTQEQLNVYQYYNPTDLKLEANFEMQGGGAAFIVNNLGDKYMEVNTEGNKKGTKIADDANAIKSIFVHENNHYENFKNSDWKEYSSPSNRDTFEQMAVRAQIKDPIFAKTSKAFQKSQL